MVFRGQLDGLPASVSLKNSSVALAVGVGAVTAWDLAGRLYSVFRHGHTFRRGLSGHILHKWRNSAAVPEAESAYEERQRVFVDDEEGARLLDEAARLAERARRAMVASPGRWRDEHGRAPGERLLATLDACARFDAPAAREDAARFSQVYAPIGVLPPDQYLSVVLQATSGCSFGSCTFCGLYHDAYRVKTPGEFSRHIAAVREYLGASVLLRKQAVFLGSANALAVPIPRLLELLGLVREAFGGSPPPVHAFVDGFTGSLKDPEAYRALAGHGLGRVYIGLESGHDPLLAFVRKPGTRAQAVETVRAIKDAGLSVGVIVMMGLGGHRFASPHATDTVAAVNAMALGAGDLVFFSDLVEVPGTSYPALAAAADVRPLSLAERRAQLRAVQAGLRFAGEPPKFARYDIREFVY